MTDCNMAYKRENMFIHRYQETADANKTGMATGRILTRFDLRPSSQLNYWKSPYANDSNSIFNDRKNLTSFPKPKIAIIASKYQRKATAGGSNSAIRGILKHKDKQEMMSETFVKTKGTTQSASHKNLNLITTGTGSGRPHGMPERSHSVEKHVKFDHLPTPYSASDGNISITGASFFRASGNRYNVKRNVPPVRQLGSGLINNRKPFFSSSVVTLSGGESHIKSQIESFVKRLRMAESAKLVKMAEGEEERKEAASKSSKNRSLSVGRYFHDWKEFDLDNNNIKSWNESEISSSSSHDNVNDKNGKFELNKTDEGDILSDRDSLSSTTLDIGDESTNKQAKPRQMASLHTKYRHITTNDVNLHKYDDRYQQFVLGRDVLRQSGSTDKVSSLYFCDPQKACDIISWLEGVKAAASKTTPTA